MPSEFESNAAPSFASMARGADSTAPTETQLEEAVAPQLSDDTQPVEQPVAQVAEEVTEQAAPAVEERSTFEARLRSRGYDVPDDVDPEDLYDQAIERISAGTQALSELDKLRAELAQLRQAQAAQPTPQIQAAPTQQAPAAPIAQAIAEVEQRMFRELKRYDNALEQYVTRDARGTAAPKPEYGAQAIEAANQINAYEKAERDQAALLLQNPHLLIQDHKAEFEKLAEAKANAIVEAHLKAWRDEQAKAQQEQTVAQQRTIAEQQQEEWHNANKSKIFKLGTDGEPLKSPFDNSQPALTATGKVFMDKYWQLQERFPNADRLACMNEALEYAQLATPPAPVRAQTHAEQRAALFAQQRKAVVPHQNVTPASSHELESDRPGKLKFSDMARFNPETAEIINNWK